jgi:DNA-binding XRE family transcriptional regulator
MTNKECRVMKGKMKAASKSARPRIAELRNELQQLIGCDENKLWQCVGTNLRLRREEVGMTQVELADTMGYSRTSLVNLEQGRQRLPLDKLIQLARLLEMPIEDVICGIY